MSLSETIRIELLLEGALVARIRRSVFLMSQETGLREDFDFLNVMEEGVKEDLREGLQQLRNLHSGSSSGSEPKLS